LAAAIVTDVAAPLEKLLTPADVGELLGVEAKTARRLRDFPWHDVGTGSRPMLRCSRAEYEQWFATRRRDA